MVKEAGANGVVVGLSGGVDSAVVGALCVRALGKENVTVVLMPSKFTAQTDIEDAEVLAYTWGARVKKVEISPLADSLTSAFDFEPGKVPRANIQARVRMVILYYLSNSSNLLVAGTGDRSEEALGFFCYDEKTRVVTTDGLKGYNELHEGDVVFSYEPESGRIVESTVDGVFVFDYSGKMVQFGGRCSDLLVTPNHRMLIRTSSDPTYSKVRFREAKDCLGLKKVVAPVPSYWKGTPGLPESIPLTFAQKHISRTVSIPVTELMYVVGLFIGDGIPVKGKVVEPVVSELSRAQYTSLARDSSGRFVEVPAESREPRMKTYDAFETDFALPIPDKNTARRKLVEFLNRYEIGYSLTRDLVRIPGKGIYEFFLQFGAGAQNKHIPRWIMQYPSEILSSLLRGLKDSDGSHAENSNVYYTSSVSLKDDFAELAAKLGRYPTARLRPPRTSHYNGKEIRSGRSYDISYGKGGHYGHTFDTSRAKIVSYSGKVWCPSVPPFENLLVERNGRYVFCGNTKFGDGGVDFLPIAHLFKTQVRELGRHLGLPERVVTKPASPGLWPGHTAAEELPADYDVLDPLLSFLFDKKLSPREAAKKAAVDLAVAKKVMEMHGKTEHKRALPPSLA